MTQFQRIFAPTYGRSGYAGFAESSPAALFCVPSRHFIIAIALNAAAARTRAINAAVSPLPTAIVTTPRHSEAAVAAYSYHYTVPAARHAPTAHNPTAVHIPYWAGKLLNAVAVGDEPAAAENSGIGDVGDKTASVVQRRAC